MMVKIHDSDVQAEKRLRPFCLLKSKLLSWAEQRRFLNLSGAHENARSPATLARCSTTLLQRAVETTY